MSSGPDGRTFEFYYRRFCCVSLGKPLPSLGPFHSRRENWMSRSQSLLLTHPLRRITTRKASLEKPLFAEGRLWAKSLAGEVLWMYLLVSPQNYLKTNSFIEI